MLVASSPPFGDWDGTNPLQTRHVLTVSGLISRIKTLVSSPFHEGQVLRAPELETAPLSSFVLPTHFFTWGIIHHSYASGGRELG